MGDEPTAEAESGDARPTEGAPAGAAPAETGVETESGVAETGSSEVETESTAAIEAGAAETPSSVAETAGANAEAETDDESPEPYSLVPLLERSAPDAAGPVEVSLSLSGTGDIDDGDVDVFLVDPHIGRGDAIELGIFVSGVGDVTEADLSVFYDEEGILDVADPGTIQWNRGAGVEPDAVGDAPADGGPAGAVHSATFRRPGASALDRESLTGSHRADPAYVLELNTRRDASPGEYRLPVVFTYRSGGDIKQVRTTPRIRIDGPLARARPWLRRLATVGLLGAVLGGVAALAGWLPVPF